jgi:hypothetical protein
MYTSGNGVRISEVFSNTTFYPPDNYVFVGAMNPYRNWTFYLHVSFSHYPSELLNGSFHVSPAVKRWAAPTQPVLAAGSCVCFG